MTNRQILGWTLVGVIAVIAAVAPPGPEKQQRPEPVAKAQPEQTDSEAGMAIVIAKRLKAAMNNPKSFDLGSLIVFDGGSACYQYRATNAFNAIMPGKAVFDAKSGVVTIHTDSGFVKTWNRICTHKAGREIAARARQIAGL